ncbi:MAG: hypothetical protein Q8R83_09025 [Legionellaceae bacterium]|nr:hypothetical protein [Legionellaceae bacterium]
MRNSVDEKTIPHRTLFEQLGVNHPWLAKELKENELLYTYAAVLYAAEDAANLVFSLFSLGFAFNDAFHERNDGGSGNEYHEFESSLEGLIITIVGTVFLVTFSSLGTYFADVDPNESPFKYYIYICWNYLRDTFKPLKWAYKGIRSTLTLILRLTDNSPLLFHLLFPITISFGILAVIARIWLRSMKTDRKLMMKQNEVLCEEIYAQSNAIIWLPKLPNKKDALPYVNSFIYVNNDTEKQLYYVYKGKSKDKDKDKNKDKTEGEEGEGDNEIQFEPIEVNFDVFTKALQTLQSENLCRQMNLYSLNKDEIIHFRKELPIATPVNPQQEAVVVESTLFVGSDYANSIIYLTDSDLKTTEAFYIVDNNGIAKQDIERGVRFERQLQEDLKKSLNLGITAQQLSRLIPDNVAKKYTIDHTYEKWTEYKQGIEGNIQKQLPGLETRCYIVTTYSAMIDALYFYMGVLFVAMFSPHLFIAMLAMSSLLFTVCMISRIYEEYDFQRKLKITCLNVLIAASDTESRLLDWEFDKLQQNMLLQTEEPLDELAAAKILERQLLDKLAAANILEKLYKQIEIHQDLQNQLEAKTVLSFRMLLIEALKSGLAFQGVISSLMFLIMAIMVLNATPCPPVFVFAFLSVALACFILSFAQYVISYQHYIKTLTAERDLREDGNLLHATWKTEYAKAFAADDLILQRRILLNAKAAVENHRIKPIQKFDLLGWWEVWRLFNSGIVKTEKTFGEITLHRSAPDESWIMLVVSLIFAVMMGVMFALRTIQKMFGESEKKVVVLEKFDDVSFPVVDEAARDESCREKFGLFRGKNPPANNGDMDSNRLVSLQVEF